MICEHTNELEPVPPRTVGCEECQRTGCAWVHLRLCLTCGHVGCCDSSPGRHATKHFRQARHPVVASLKPGEHGRGATSMRSSCPCLSRSRYTYAEAAAGRRSPGAIETWPCTTSTDHMPLDRQRSRLPHAGYRRMRAQCRYNTPSSAQFPHLAKGGLGSIPLNYLQLMVAKWNTTRILLRSP